MELHWGSLPAAQREQRAGALLWLALLVGSSLLVSLLLYRERRPGIVNETAGVYRLPAALPELSGLARGRGGALWGHNDSLDLPQIFALDRTGNLLARYLLRGAEHVDWEDITSDHSGRLYLGDMGNNFHWRQRLTIYEIYPPSPSGRSEERKEQLSVSRHWELCYPALPEGSTPLTEGNSPRLQAPLTPLRCRAPLPPWESEARRYDSEALFWAPTAHAGGSLYLFDKAYLGGASLLYRLPIVLAKEVGREERAFTSRATSPLPLHPFAVAEVGPPHPPTGARVTAADLSPDGRCLVVLSYHYISLFSWPPQRPWRPVVTRPIAALRLRQAEAVLWVENETIWIGSEGLQRAELSGSCERKELTFGMSRGG